MASSFLDPNEYLAEQQNSDANLPMRMGGLNKILSQNLNSFTEQFKGNLAGSVEDQRGLFEGITQFGKGAEEQQNNVTSQWLAEKFDQLAESQDQSRESVAERMKMAISGNKNTPLSEAERGVLEEYRSGLQEADKFQNPMKPTNGNMSAFSINNNHGDSFGEAVTFNFDGGTYTAAQFDTNEEGQRVGPDGDRPWKLIKNERTWSQTNDALEKQIAEREKELAYLNTINTAPSEGENMEGVHQAAFVKDGQLKARNAIEELKAKQDALANGSSGFNAHIQGELTDFIKADENLLKHVPQGEGAVGRAYTDAMAGFAIAEVNTAAGLKYLSGDTQGARELSRVAKEAERGRAELGQGQIDYAGTNLGGVMRELGPELVQTVADVALGAGVMKIVDGGLNMAARSAGRAAAAGAETAVQEGVSRLARDVMVEGLKDKLHGRFGRAAEVIIDAGPGAMEEASTVLGSLDNADEYKLAANKMDLQAKIADGENGAGSGDEFRKEAEELRRKSKVIEENAALAFYSKAAITLATDAIGFDQMLTRGPLDATLDTKATRSLARKQLAKAGKAVTEAAVDQTAEEIKTQTAERVSAFIAKLDLAGKVKEVLKTGNFEGMMEVVQSVLNTATTNAFLEENNDILSDGSVQEYAVGALIGGFVKTATVNMTVAQQRKMSADILDKKKSTDERLQNIIDQSVEKVRHDSTGIEGFGKVQHYEEVVRQDETSGKWVIRDDKDVASAASPTGLFGHLEFNNKEDALEFSRGRWQKAFESAMRTDLRNQMQASDKPIDQDTFAPIGDAEVDALVDVMSKIAQSTSAQTGVDVQTFYASNLQSHENYQAVDLGNYAGAKVYNQVDQPAAPEASSEGAIWIRPTDGERFIYNKEKQSWDGLSYEQMHQAPREDYDAAAQALLEKVPTMTNLTPKGREGVTTGLRQFLASATGEMPANQAAAVMLKNTARSFAVQRNAGGTSGSRALKQETPKAPGSVVNTIKPRVSASEPTSGTAPAEYTPKETEVSKPNLGVGGTSTFEGRKPLEAEKVFGIYKNAKNPIPSWITSPYSMGHAILLRKKATEHFRSKGLTDEEIKSEEIQAKIGQAVAQKISTVATEGEIEEVALRTNNTKDRHVQLVDSDGKPIPGTMRALSMPMSFSFGERATQSSKAEPRQSYGTNVSSLGENDIFVFGSNEDGFHGAGSAGFSSFGVSGNVWREKDYGSKPSGWKGKWNVKGVGRGLQTGTDGSSYALPTVRKAGLKQSLTSSEIASNIREMYAEARKAPGKRFLVAGSANGKLLNGYSHREMVAMYKAAGPIPSNVLFSDSYASMIFEDAPATSGTYQAILDGKRRSTTRFMSAADSPAPGSVIFIKNPNKPGHGMFAIVRQNYTLGQRLDRIHKEIAATKKDEWTPEYIKGAAINRLAAELEATEGYPKGLARQTILSGGDWRNKRHVKFLPVSADYAMLRMTLAGHEVTEYIKASINGAIRAEAGKRKLDSASLLGRRISDRGDQGRKGNDTPVTPGMISGPDVFKKLQDDREKFKSDAGASTYIQLLDSITDIVNASGLQVLDGFEAPNTSASGEVIADLYKHLTQSAIGNFEKMNAFSQSLMGVSARIFPGASGQDVQRMMNEFSASFDVDGNRYVPNGLSTTGDTDPNRDVAPAGDVARRAIMNGDMKMIKTDPGDTISIDKDGAYIRVMRDGKPVPGSALSSDASTTPTVLVFVDQETGRKTYYQNRPVTKGEWKGKRRLTKLDPSPSMGASLIEEKNSSTPMNAIGLMFLRVAAAYNSFGITPPWVSGPGGNNISAFGNWMVAGGVDKLRETLPNWKDYKDGWTASIGDDYRLLEALAQHYRNTAPNVGAGRIAGEAPLSSFRDQRRPDDHGRVADMDFDDDSRGSAGTMNEYLSGGLGRIGTEGPQSELTEEEAQMFSNIFTGPSAEGDQAAPFTDDTTNDLMSAIANDVAGTNRDISREDLVAMEKGTDSQRDDVMMRILMSFGLGEGEDADYKAKTEILNGLKERRDYYVDALDAIDENLAASTTAPGATDEAAKKNVEKRRQELETLKLESLKALEAAVQKAEADLTAIQIKAAERTVQTTTKNGKVDPDYRDANAAARKRVDDTKKQSAERQKRPDLDTRYREVISGLETKEDPSKVEGSKDNGYGSTALKMLRMESVRQMDKQIEDLSNDLRRSTEQMIQDDEFNVQSIEAILWELDQKPKLIEDYNKAIAELQDLALTHGKKSVMLANKINTLSDLLASPDGLSDEAITKAESQLRSAQSKFDSLNAENKAAGETWKARLAELKAGIEQLELQLKGPDLVSLYSDKTQAEKIAKGIVGNLWYKDRVRPALDHLYSFRSGYSDGLPNNFVQMSDKAIADVGTMMGLGREAVMAKIAKWEEANGEKTNNLGIKTVGYRARALEIPNEEIINDPLNLLEFLWCINRGRWAAKQQLADRANESFKSLKQKSQALGVNRLTENALMPKGWTRPISDEKMISTDDDPSSSGIDRERIAPDVMSEDMLSNFGRAATFAGRTPQRFDAAGNAASENEVTDSGDDSPMGYELADQVLSFFDESSKMTVEALNDLMGDSSTAVAARIQRAIEAIGSLPRGSRNSLKNDMLRGEFHEETLKGFDRLLIEAVKDINAMQGDETAQDIASYIRRMGLPSYSIIDNALAAISKGEGTEQQPDGPRHGRIINGLVESAMLIPVNGVPVSDLIKVTDESIAEIEDKSEKREARKQLWKNVFSSSELAARQWETISNTLMSNAWKGVVSTKAADPRQSHEQAIVDLWTEGYTPKMQPLVSTLYSKQPTGELQMAERGSITIPKTGLPKIKLNKGLASASTFLHETIHWMRVVKLGNGQSLFDATVGAEGMDTLMRWATQDGKLKPSGDISNPTPDDIAIEEAFATGVEKYFADHQRKGNGPIARLARFIKDFYEQVYGPGKANLPADVRASFDNLFYPGLAAKRKQKADGTALKAVRLDIGDANQVMSYAEKLGYDLNAPVLAATMKSVVVDGASEAESVYQMSGPIDPVTDSGKNPTDYSTVVAGYGPGGMITEQTDLEAGLPEGTKEMAPVLDPVDTKLQSYTPIATAPLRPQVRSKMAQNYTNLADQTIMAKFLRHVYKIGSKLRINGTAPKQAAMLVIEGKNMRAQIETALSMGLQEIKAATDEAVTAVAGGLNLRAANSARMAYNKMANDFLSSPDRRVRAVAFYSMPGKLRVAMLAARYSIDRLSDVMINRGIAYGPMVATINANREFYIHRTFNFPSGLLTPEMRMAWVESPANATVLTRTIQQLIAKKIVPNAAEAMAMIEKTVNTLAGADAEKTSPAGGNNFYTSPGGLTSTKLTREEAEIMGELLGLETNAEKNYANTIHAMTHLLMVHDIESAIRDAGLRDGYLSRTDRAAPGHTARFHKDRSNDAIGRSPVDPNVIDSQTAATLGPLYGYSTSPEIAEWFAEVKRNELEFSKELRILSVLRKTNAGWKVLNTIYNPVTAVKNIWGAYMSYLTTGHVFRGLRRSAKIVAAQEFGNTKLVQKWLGGKAEVDRHRQIYQMLVANGAAESGSFNDLKDLMERAPDFRGIALTGILTAPTTGSQVGDEISYRATSKLNSLRKLFTRFYMYGDSYFKMAAFYGELDNLVRAYPSATADERDRMAATRVADTMFSFEREPYWLRNFKRYNVFSGNFFSFGYGMLRAGLQGLATGVNDVREGARRWRAGEPGGRFQVYMGSKRLAALTSFTAVVPFAANYISSLFGWDEEKKKAAMALMPDFDRDGTIFFLSNYKPGESAFYFNASNLLPYSYGVDGAAKLAQLIPSLINDYVNGNTKQGDKKFEDYFQSAIDHWSKPWFDEAPALKLANILINKTDERGDPIYGADAGLLNKAYGHFRAITRLFMPGAGKAAANLDILPDKAEQFILGKKATPLPLTHKAAYLAGFRIGTFDVERGFKFEIERSLGIYTDARSRFAMDLLSRSGPVDLEGMTAMVDQFDKSANLAIMKASAVIDNGATVGMNPVQILQGLRDSHPGPGRGQTISKQMMLDILTSNGTRAINLSKETLFNVQRAAEEVGDRQRLPALLELIRQGRVQVESGR